MNIENVPPTIVYLMGISFVLGSLTSIFLLVLLEMFRKIAENSSAERVEAEEQD